MNKYAHLTPKKSIYRTLYKMYKFASNQLTNQSAEILLIQYFGTL